MTRKGLALGVAATAAAVAIAAGGAIANLQLLEPHRPTATVLGSSLTNGQPSTSNPSTPESPTTTTPGELPTGTTRPPEASTTSIPGASADQPSQTFGVGSAGKVTVAVRSGALTLEAVVPRTGWTYEIEVKGPREVEVSFRDAEREASFHASLHEGQVRVEIETEDGSEPDD